MSRKPKFQLEITCIELNPEQAVLSCCSGADYYKLTTTKNMGGAPVRTWCNADTRRTYTNTGYCYGQGQGDNYRLASSTTNS